MGKQYLDKDGLEVVRDKIDEARQVAAGAMGLAQAAMEKSSSVYPSAPTTPEIVFDKLNQSSNIDATYTVTKKAFHIVRVHCYSEGESHSAQVYLNGVQIGSESSYNATSGVGYTVTIHCNVGDIIRMVVSCGGSGTYDVRSASIYRLN